MTPLKIAAAGGAVITLLLMFAIKPHPVPADAAEEEERFDETWIDVMRPLALKTAEVKRAAYIPVSTDSKPVADAVRIITPAPDGAPASMPPVVMVQDDDKPPASRHRRQRASDVCGHHGMHKVVSRKSWKCRR